MRLTQKTFTSSTTWTAPAGVTSIIVFGQGGGGGGGAGGANIAPNLGVAQRSGAGGIATFLVPRVLTVTPNTTYTITIGSGGTGATYGVVGSPGGTTSFGSLASWQGGACGLNGNNVFSSTYTSDGNKIGGYITSGSTSTPSSGIINFPYSVNFDSSTSASHSRNYGTFGSVASNGANGASGTGGIAGNSSDAGIGGAGGTGAASSSNGGNGSNAPGTSYGAGGGGGGAAAANSNSVSGGTGGNGAGGRLIVMWAE